MSDVITGVPATPQPAAEAPAATDNAQNPAPEMQDQGVDIDSEEAAIAEQEASGQMSKKDAAAARKKLKLKIDGEEEDFEVPEDEQELVKYFQKAKAFDKRVKEFSGYKSQVDQMLEMLQNDPEAFLEKAGFNVDDLAEKRLSRKVEEMKKSPEQLEREKMAKELEDLRKEKKAAEEARQKAEAEKIRNQEAQQIQNDIMEALESNKSVLPKKNPVVYQRIAQALYFAITNGYPQATVKDVLPIVEKQWKEEMSSYFNEGDDDYLENIVGKSRLDTYRKAQIAKKRNQVPAKPKVEDTGIKKPKEDKQVEKVSMKDFFSMRPKR